MDVCLILLLSMLINKYFLKLYFIKNYLLRIFFNSFKYYSLPEEIL